MPTAALASWLLTFLLHSLLLGTAALVGARFVRRPEARAVIFRGALLGGIATATLVSVVGLGPSIRVATPDVHRGRTIALRVGDAAGSTTTRPTAQPARLAPAATGEATPRQPAPTGTRAGDSSAATARTIDLTLAFALIAAMGLGAARFLRSTLTARARLAQRVPLARSPAHAAHGPRVDALLAELDAPAGTRISVARDLDVPLALGQRELVLPERALDELDTDELRALLAHELAHLARRDPLWLGAARLVHALTWFQPLQRVLLRRLQDESELATDALAVARTRQPIALARTLERVAGWIVARPTPAFGVAMARRGASVLSRIERLLALRDVPAPRPTGRVAFTTLSALALVTCCAPEMRTEARVGLSGAEAFAMLAPAIDMAEESGKPIWKRTTSDGSVVDFGERPWRASAPVLELHLSHDPERTDCPPIQAFGQQLEDAGAAAELARRAKERCPNLLVHVASTAEATERSVADLLRALARVDVAASHAVVRHGVAMGRVIDSLRMPGLHDEDASVRVTPYSGPDAEPFEQRFRLRLDERGDLRGLPPGRAPFEFVSSQLASAHTGPLDPTADGPQPEVIRDRLLIECEATTPFEAVLHWREALAGPDLGVWKAELALARGSDADIVAVFLPCGAGLDSTSNVRWSNGRVFALELGPGGELRVDRDAQGLVYRLWPKGSEPLEARDPSVVIERAFRQGVQVNLDVRPPVTFGEVLPFIRMAAQRGTRVMFIGAHTRSTLQEPSPKD